MDVDAAIEEARKLRSKRQHREALSVLAPFIASETTNADVWWVSGLAHHSMDALPEATFHFRKVVKLVPRYGLAWAQLGATLLEVGQKDEGRKVLFHALRVQPDNAFAMNQLAKDAREEKDYERELTFLLAIDSLGKSNGYALNTLGICFLNLKRFNHAIEAFHRSVAQHHSGEEIESIRDAIHPLFNLALVYNNHQISQDVDAIDVLRRALLIKPDDEGASKKLATISAKLDELTKKSRHEGSNLLAKDEWFQFYLNPLELLGTDDLSSIDEIDPKWIQRKKKRLLHTLDLDGQLDQLENAEVDRSRVLSVVDELHNQELRDFHWRVFRCPQLLRFLTRGEIDHFLYDENYFPIEMLSALDDERFRGWISTAFAPQFNAVLGRALDRRAFSVVESLFDGRRWTIPEHDPLCFATAHRYIDRLIEPLALLATKSIEEKPDAEAIAGLLDGVRTVNYQRQEGIVVKILNLLPEPFREQQTDAVRSIRQISLAAYNEHGDLELSRKILTLSRKFQFKNASLLARLEEDFEALDRLNKDQRKFEAKFTRGSIPIEVTKDGVRDGEAFFPINSILSIRYGISASRIHGIVVNEFVLVFANIDAQSISLGWTPRKDIEKNREIFNQFIQASLAYVLPAIAEKLESRIIAGEQIKIGNCVLQATGVWIQTQGWVFTKQHFIPWSRVKTDLEQGQVQVFDAEVSKIKTSMPLKDTPNAGAIEFLAMKFRSSKKLNQ